MGACAQCVQFFWCWLCSQVSFAQSNAIADGDIATAEKQYFEKLMLQEKVIAL